MRLLPQASSYSATTVRSGATQHQCPESKRVRQQIVTGPKTQGVQQTKLALPSIFQTPQQYIAPPDVRDEMARGQRSSFTSQSVISRSSGCDDRYSDHMSARRQDDFNSRMTDVTRRAPVYESSWPHDNRPPPFGPPPHEPSLAITRPSSQPADMTCRCAQGQNTIAGRQWTNASLRGRRAATQRIVSTVAISQLGALRMAVTTAAAADTQALMGIRTAAASPPRGYPYCDGYQRDLASPAYGRYPNDYSGRDGRDGHPPGR